MKYNMKIWTDHGFTWDLTLDYLPDLNPQWGLVQIKDVDGKDWFFNWGHLSGGKISKIDDTD